MAYAIEDIIGWAKITGYLSTVDTVKRNALDGGRLDFRHPRLLYMERKSLEYLYAEDDTDPDLFEIGNYVLSLCGGYLSQAQYIYSLGAGGTIVNVNTGKQASIEGFREQLQVPDDLAEGATSYTVDIADIVDGTIKVELPQDNVPQGQTNQFSWSVSYNANNATISFYNIDGSTNYGVQNGMLIIITGLKFINV